MKLSLGTVQLGLPYGVNNAAGIPVDNEVKRIFSVAKSADVDSIDTAIAYGDAEKKIGMYSGGGFKIVTKLPAFPTDGFNYKWLSDTVDASLERLQTDKLHGILLHRPLQLLEKDGRDLFKSLQRLKSEGKVNKIGVSIYEPSELESIAGIYKLDIVQAPLNIFDQRLIRSGWLSKLAEEGVEVHTRSVFLQGLLLVEPSKRLAKFDPWKDVLAKYDSWLENSGYTALQACIRFALSFPEISNVIIGIDNSDHLRQILAASLGPSPIIPDDLSSDDIKLINPLAWLDF